jgi:hypothetical protein
VAAAGFALVVLVVGAVGLFVSRAPDENTVAGQSTTSVPVGVVPTVVPPPTTSVPPPTTPSGAPWPLPRLVLDLEGWELITETSQSFTVNPEMPVDETVYLQTFRAAPDRFDPPMVWLETDYDGSDFFRGEQYREPGWEPVDVGGLSGFLRETGTDRGGLILNWELPDQTAVSLTSRGVDREALLGFAGGLTARGDQPGWETTTLPDGVQLSYDGPTLAGPDRSEAATTETQWVGPEGQVSIVLETAGWASLEGRLYQTVGASADSVTSVAIRGTTGALIVDHDATILLWIEGDVFGWVTAQGAGIRSDRLVEALIEIDEAAWQQRVEGTGLTGQERYEYIDALTDQIPLPAGGTFDLVKADLPEGRIDSRLLQEMVVRDAGCQWLVVWLDADRSGDDATKLEATEAFITMTPSWPSLDGSRPYGYLLVDAANSGDTETLRTALADASCHAYQVP